MCHTSIRRNGFWRGIAILLAFSSTVPSSAEQNKDALTVELSVVAKELSAIISSKGGGTVAVGEFSHSSDIRGSVGPQIQRALAAQLRAANVQVDPKNYRYEIKGDYQAKVDKETGVLGAELQIRLIEHETGEPIPEKPTGRFIFGSETVPRMLGLTVHTNPGQDPLERSEVFKQARKKSGASNDGASLRADPSSPYAVELVVKRGDNWTACSFDRDDRDCPVAKLQRNDVISFRLRNDSEFAAAVNLTIDGVNTLSTATEPKSEFWLIPAKDQLLVQGWWMSDKESRQFNLAEIPEIDSLNSRFVSTHGQRMVTAAFSAAWRDDSDRPKDEPHTRCSGPLVAAVESNSPTLQSNYQIGEVRDVITFLIDTGDANSETRLKESPTETKLEGNTFSRTRLAAIQRSLSDGPIRIEILRKTDTGYEPAPHETKSDGGKDVMLVHKEPLAFKVVNDTDHEMAVRLSFDGVNVLAFDERGRMLDYFVVKSNSYSVVTGWPKDGDNLPFVPGEFPESDRVVVDKSIPGIHATFAVTWTNGNDVDRNVVAAQVEFRNTASGPIPVRWVGPVVKTLEADYSIFR